MKIEKISEIQIRCTLTKKDLADRQIGLGDLTYGAPKARELFRDMMELAFSEFGFEAEDIPLMIEAMPLPGESLVLVITKIENPDELDTRFSRLTPYQGAKAEEPEKLPAPGADEVLNAFSQIHKILKDAAREAAGKQQEPGTPKEVKVHLTRIYSFRSLEEVIRMARTLSPYYSGKNSLYKKEDAGLYYLIAQKSGHTPEEFNKICNMITEYSSLVPAAYAAAENIREHCELIIADNAVEVRAGM